MTTTISFNAPTPSPIALGAVKVLLHDLGFSFDGADRAVRQSLRLVRPLDRSLAESVRASATSLTDAATSEEQIRFSQQRRADRSYIKLAQYLASRLGGVRIEIGNAGDLDDPSRAFFRIAARVCGWEVRYREEPLPGVITSQRFTPEEHDLVALLDSVTTSEEVQAIWTAAFEYINVGDAWTGVALGRLLARFEQSPRVWNLLALGHAMLNQTESAEFYYRRWAADGGTVDKIRAYYGQSMLYARHHPDGLRNLDTAADLLTAAYELLGEVSEVDRVRDELVFEEVFNRNGYALILFRRGLVDEALGLLEWGISQLTMTNEKVAIHRSVLMYNLAQCHRQLGNLDDAVDTYRRLLVVDPYMPEYHLEAAKCMADNGDVTGAIAAVREALVLDDTLDVAWSLLGVYLGQIGVHEEASGAFGEASRLNPRLAKHRLDHAYSLVLAGDLDGAERALDTAVPVAAADVERHASLTAEVRLKRGDARGALGAIELALKRVPTSVSLKQNRSVLIAR